MTDYSARIHHICVPVDRAIEELQKGNNLFTCSADEAARALWKNRSEGKKYITGCDNEDEEGRCKGHEPRKGILVTKDEADKIIIDWNRENKPYKRIVCCWKGQWYDVRELTEWEVNSFIRFLTGITPNKENTMDINLK